MTGQLEEPRDALGPPIVVPGRGQDIQTLLSREWLIANRIGSYASSTVVGCNTRRYHGLLVAATLPPTGRIVAVSNVLEDLLLHDETYHLATNEFADTFSPRGAGHLEEFRNDVCPTFLLRAGKAVLVKEIVLADASNAVAVRYTLHGASGLLRLLPLTPMRDFHKLRKVHEPNQMSFERTDGGAVVMDRMRGEHSVYLITRDGQFQPKPQWWYRFRYRIDVRRGQDGFEDLYTPGWFECDLADGQCVQFTASLNGAIQVNFEGTSAGRRQRLSRLADAVGADADETTRRLAAATDAFVVQRGFPGTPSSATILAGYHWFADWGRDAFIALPGLLLTTRRFDQARQVFRTFAGHISAGLVPNRFDDYSVAAHYNSIDASLWFAIAAGRYVSATGDMEFWRQTLQPAIEAILSAYQAGTQFDIRADADGLITGGSPQTQLTWMDAALGDEAITPRHGKAVEVNALWYAAHRIMAQHCREGDEALARQYDHQADLIQPAFVRTFWNDQAGCLYDCVSQGGPDASIRANQIFAVSLPYSPLTPPQQAAVVRMVHAKLLTPLGLRTLSPDDSRYRQRYGGSWESRDRAYHQGTVWAWLIGPFIEAFLKVNESNPAAAQLAKQMLSAFTEHLEDAALGYISEIFDAESPHHPGGCVAQAWSVAEVLRAKRLVDEKLRPV